VVDAALLCEAWDQRMGETQRKLREQLVHARERAKQSHRSRIDAEKEPDWRTYGDLLKSLLHAPPPVEWEGPAGREGSRAYRSVPDWSTGDIIRLPCDPKLSDARAQIEKFYTLARRKQRRLEEATARGSAFDQAAERYQTRLASPPVFPAWKGLEDYEREAGILRKLTQADAAGGGKTQGKSAFSARNWSGKTFVSRDGYPIWVGRTKDENLELTFKHARGNDIWMHVKGKPGAHVVVPIPAAKSASLETLLDAAQLTLFYSGGQNWGKTEIDYTFKKHVKRIRDSTEASYTQNRTLLVQNDAERLKRLLEQNPSA
jgi:predicted ribosome quality control (RQC) complex YloA/Tae2 family protein